MPDEGQPSADFQRRKLAMEDAVHAATQCADALASACLNEPDRAYAASIAVHHAAAADLAVGLQWLRESR